jgi:hypothetical protein
MGELRRARAVFAIYTSRRDNQGTGASICLDKVGSSANEDAFDQMFTIHDAEDGRARVPAIGIKVSGEETAVARQGDRSHRPPELQSPCQTGGFEQSGDFPPDDPDG